MEAVFIAAAALVLSAGAVFLIWPMIGKRIYGNIEGIAEPTGTVPAIAVFAVTAGCGILVLLLSAALSSVGIMRMNPKEILSKLS